MATTVDEGADLQGFVVGVTADRRADEQAILLRRLGVEVLAGPAMATFQAPGDEDGPLRGQLEAMIADPPDYLVANTGIGVRILLERAVAWGLDDDLRRTLADARLVARGPKAAGALRLAGLPVWWRAPGEQLAEVQAHLLAEGVDGARIVLQLHGDARQGLSAALRRAGAQVRELEVYRWSLPPDASAVTALIEACCAGQVDAVTFTAAPAVRNLLEVADARGQASRLLDVLNRDTIVACVGPVCAAAAHQEGLAHPVVPEHWRLGSLVKEVGAALSARRLRLRTTIESGGVEIVVQGSCLVVDGEAVALTAEERVAVRRLALAAGEAVTIAAPGEAGRVIQGLRIKLGRGGKSLEQAGPGVYRWFAGRSVG